MARKLRFGIIGCGVIGRTHARTIHALQEDAVLVAVADELPARAEQLGREFAAQAYGDYRELLARSDVDVVCICTPSGMHARHTMDTLRAGRHVICEKPFDITLGAIDAALRYARTSDRKLAVIFQNRFHAASQIVHQAASTGQFGRLTYASAQVPWWRGPSYFESGAWRGTWQLDGGGCLMNQGVHTIDLLQWCMGPVVEVQAYTATLAHRGIEVEDVAVAAVKFASGALGTIQGSTAVYPGLPVRLVVGGDGGSAIIEGERLTWFHARQEGEEAGAYGGGHENQAEAVLAAHGPVPVEGAVAGPPPRAHVYQIADMIHAVRENRQPAVGGEEARKAVAIILATYESARTGRPVRVDQGS